jgi:hypothetical protein
MLPKEGQTSHFEIRNRVEYYFSLAELQENNFLLEEQSFQLSISNEHPIRSNSYSMELESVDSLLTLPTEM